MILRILLIALLTGIMTSLSGQVKDTIILDGNENIEGDLKVVRNLH